MYLLDPRSISHHSTHCPRDGPGNDILHLVQVFVRPRTQGILPSTRSDQHSQKPEKKEMLGIDGGGFGFDHVHQPQNPPRLPPSNAHHPNPQPDQKQQPPEDHQHPRSTPPQTRRHERYPFFVVVELSALQPFQL